MAMWSSSCKKRQKVSFYSASWSQWGDTSLHVIQNGIIFTFYCVSELEIDYLWKRPYPQRIIGCNSKCEFETDLKKWFCPKLAIFTFSIHVTEVVMVIVPLITVKFESYNGEITPPVVLINSHWLHSKQLCFAQFLLKFLVHSTSKAREHNLLLYHFYQSLTSVWCLFYFNLLL